MIASSARSRREPAVAHELGEELGVVDDLVAAAEVRVLVRDRVEAVRAARDDLRHAGLVQRRDVLLRERLEHVLVAHPAGGVAGAGLARTEDRDVDSRGEQQLHRRLGGAPRTLVERGRAADPVQNLGAGSLPARARGRRGRSAQAARSVLRLAPGVRAALDVAQHRLGLGGKARVDHDQMPAQVDDVIDVLDRDRALVDAGAAGHAVPDDLVRHGVRHERASARTPVGAAPSGPSAKTWSRRSMIRSFGESSLPVA